MAIYYLDVDDEITSAAARIRGSTDAHIALVMPTGSRVATSRINFKRLSIVAPDAQVRSLAQSAGLPVFENVRAYEAAESGPPQGIGPEVPGDVSEALVELGATIAPSARGSRSIRGGGPIKGGATGGAAAAGSADATGRAAGGGRRLGVSSLLLIGLLAIIVVVGAFAAYQFWPSATVVLPVGEATRADSAH